MYLMKVNPEKKHFLHWKSKEKNVILNEAKCCEHCILSITEYWWRFSLFNPHGCSARCQAVDMTVLPSCWGLTLFGVFLLRTSKIINIGQHNVFTWLHIRCNERHNQYTYYCKEPSLSRLYGSLIYRYLCTQCLSPLTQ